MSQEETPTGHQRYVNADSPAVLSKEEARRVEMALAFVFTCRRQDGFEVAPEARELKDRLSAWAEKGEGSLIEDEVALGEGTQPVAEVTSTDQDLHELTTYSTAYIRSDDTMQDGPWVTFEDYERLYRSKRSAQPPQQQDRGTEGPQVPGGDE